MSEETRSEEVVAVMDALGSESRLRIMQLLLVDPRDVSKISEATGLSMANASQHLRKLKSVGLLRVIKTGQSRTYHLGKTYYGMPGVKAALLYSLEPIEDAS